MVAFPSSLSSVRINPAYAAALALIAIQVSIGILFKAVQTGGQYVDPQTQLPRQIAKEDMQILLLRLLVGNDIRVPQVPPRGALLLPRMRGQTRRRWSAVRAGAG
jgi:hypothetical protein